MELIRFDSEEPYLRQFLALPSRLYGKRERMQDRREEEQLLRGTHCLNHYVKLTKFLVTDGRTPLARCVVTEYPGDLTAYFGFFECVEDPEAFRCLMDGVEGYVMDEQYTSLEGPLDVSLWIRYRFKANSFDLPPYTGEPYNKDYYPSFFESRAYAVKERYVSNRYRELPREDFALPAYQKRWETFAAKGYEIRSPELAEWDKAIGEIYDMIAVLYSSFLTYHAISREEFVTRYASYRPAVDCDLIKLAYYEGKAVGFFMGLPNYGNLPSLRKTPGNLLRFFQIKRHPKEYVLLYMGVMPEHRGAGMALTHCIMEELAKKGAPSIGALIRQGNPNYNYADEYLVGRYEYLYLEKKFTIQDYLRRAQSRWAQDDYIAERDGAEWRWRTFGGFAADVRRCAHWLLAQELEGGNIGIYGRNSYGWMVLDVSIMGYAGVSFPIDAQYGESELRNILRAAGLRALFYAADKEAVVRPLREEFPQIVFQSLEDAAAAYAAYGDADDFARVPPERVTKVLYTSGTVAQPKGVMLSQANMFSNWKTLYRRTPMEHSDSIYLVLPLNHVYAGVAAFLYTLISGMRIYLGDFAAEACLRDFQEVHPSVFIGVPLLAERLWELAGRSADVPAAFGGRFRYFYCGGTAIHPQLKAAYIAAGLPFLEAYGLSETSSVVALDVRGDYREGSTGVLMESVEAVIDQPDADGIGELLIKGGSVMAGYYGMPELTAEVLDDKGYFHTGDLARIDGDRHLYLLGRKRRLLLTDNGKNVYPQEIEELVCRYPQVSRATLYIEEGRLRLKVWYTGDRAAVCAWLERTREELPKYLRYQEYECVEDTEGGRIK